MEHHHLTLNEPYTPWTAQDGVNIQTDFMDGIRQHLNNLNAEYSDVFQSLRTRVNPLRFKEGQNNDR